MSTQKLIELAAATIYIAAFILTYGHSYHAPSVKVPQPETRVAGAAFCATFWPLYWSAHLMEPAGEKGQP